MSSDRGFAKMAKEDPEKLHEIAAKGGRNSHKGSSGGDTSKMSETSSDRGTGGERYFSKLAREDPDKLHNIASKGGKHSHDNT